MVYKICAIVVTLCVVTGSLSAGLFLLLPFDDSFLADCYEEGSIVVLPLYGDIVWGVGEDGSAIYGADVARVLSEVRDSGMYGGVILEIDSGGGYPVASFKLMELVEQLGVPTVAVVGEAGLSGAYAIAAATDNIFVHPVSDVGSIGVTMSYINESAANTDSGYVYESLSTGTYKDTGDPSKELTEDERSLIMKNLENVHEYFVRKVAADRGMEYEVVKELADGRWYSGTESIELGLADGIGGMDDAIAYIQNQTGWENPVCYAPTL